MVGFGSKQASIKVYFENRPPLPQYQQLASLKSLESGEIGYIAGETGNHWRKIFNCYAKFLFELNSKAFNTWQDFRDQELLQANSNQQLLFSIPDISIQNSLHIVAGRTYFHSLKLNLSIEWVDQYFAIDRFNHLIVSPYFDYRQLSNARISQLVSLVKELNQGSKTDNFKERR